MYPVMFMEALVHIALISGARGVLSIGKELLYYGGLVRERVEDEV